MDDSQLAALPPDLMAEATSMRREWETRNRFYTHPHVNTISSILRNSGKSG